MKTVFKSHKILSFFMPILLILSVVGCKDKKDQKSQKDQKVEKVQSESDKSFAGTNRSDNICELLTENDLRSVFELDDEVNIIQEKQKSNKICYYHWKPSEKRITYYANLSFIKGDRRSKSEIEEVWRVQSNFNKDYNYREVSGVGDKASWSDYAGGVLSVMAKGYLFKIDLSIKPDKNNPLNDQERIDKAKALAKKVIERI